LYRPRPGRREQIAILTSIDYRGEWYAGALAAHGVDLRDPTGDIDVVSFCLGVPAEQYLAEGVSRSLVRRAMWAILPPHVLANRRRGMQAADWFEKLERRKPAINSEIADLARSALARRAIDFDRLQTALRNWPSGNWEKRRVIEEYQLALPRGLAVGRFLRWFEQAN
jgi:asparagine synthase (glutamine-hydrolysing)